MNILCRAYLSPWCDPETGKYITIGRCNIGAVSLNLPFIWMEAKESNTEFFDLLDSKLQIIRKFLKKRYEYVAEQKCSTNPLCFTQGGLYKGTKEPTDCIGDLTQYMTASFGITALNELTLLATGETLLENNCEFAIEVIKYIRDTVQKFKEEDGYLYALYGTPKIVG